MTRLATIISSFCLIALVTGCSVFPMGAAKTGFGYSSESKFFLFHEVDGEKDGKKAGYKVEVAPTVVEKLLQGLLPETPKTESADEAGTGSESPSTSD